ncbi:DNA repair protein RadC [Candidatus Kaiserbacteria bacterium]|nr:DNA repair protein RadC [Candidatus Kaiserbacteria bacterium]
MIPIFMKLKALPKIELPREKLTKYGTERLSDYELLAIILGSGIKGVNVLTLSKSILKRVAEVGSVSLIPGDLSNVRGLGKVKRLQVVAILELAKRLHKKGQSEILSTKDIWNMCNDFYSSSKEHFVAFYLDTQSRLIERRVISVGTLDASVVHPRDVFEPALTLHAASIIVCHNHPSGSTKPSSSDIVLTKMLTEAGVLLGITLEDHVIVSRKETTSMKSEGLM